MNRLNRDSIDDFSMYLILLCFLLWLPTYTVAQERTQAPDPSNAMYASVLQFGTADAAENLFVALEALRSRGLLRYRGYMFAIPDVSATKHVTPARFAGSVDASGTRTPWPAGVVAGDNANAFLCRINHPHACLDRPKPKWRIRLYTEASRYKPPTRRELDDFCTTQNSGRAKQAGAPWHFVLCLPEIIIEETVFLKRVPFNPNDPLEKSLAHKILEQNGCPVSLEPSDNDVPQMHTRKVWCSQIFGRISLAELARLNGDGAVAVAVRAGCRKSGEHSLATLRKEWCDETERKLAADPAFASAEKAMVARGQNEIQIPTIALQLTHDIRSSELKKLERAVTSVRAFLNIGIARAPSAAISFQRTALFTHYKQQIFSPQKPLKTEATTPAKDDTRQATCAASIDEALVGDGFDRDIRKQLKELTYRDSVLIADNDFPLGAKADSSNRTDPVRVLYEGSNNLKRCQISRWKIPACQPPTQHNLKDAEKHAAAIESLIRGRRGNGSLGILDGTPLPALGFFRFPSDGSRTRPIATAFSSLLDASSECKPYRFSVVSMSLSGGIGARDFLKSNVESLAAMQILMVTPAGEVQRDSELLNDQRDCKPGADAKTCAYKPYYSSSCPAYPACESSVTPMVLSVVGIAPNTGLPLPDQRYGPRFDVAAAARVPVAVNGGIQTFEGSSSAVPIVASLALALKAKSDSEPPHLDSAAIKRRIQFTSNPQFDSKKDDGVSRPVARFGRIHFGQALDFERDDLVTEKGQRFRGFLRKFNDKGEPLWLKFQGVSDSGVDKRTDETILLTNIRRIARVSPKGEPPLFFVVYSDGKRNADDDRHDGNPLRTLRDATPVGPATIRMFNAGPRTRDENLFELDQNEPLSAEIKVSNIKNYVACSGTHKGWMRTEYAQKHTTCDGG